MTGSASNNDRWFRPLGAATAAGWDVLVDPSTAEWQYTSLRVAWLAKSQSRAILCDDWEYVVVPLSGGVRVQVTEKDQTTHDVQLSGRTSVFDGATDIAYVPKGAQLLLEAPPTRPAKVALCGAHATKHNTPPPFRHVLAQDVPVELRGTGQASREVRNFAIPDVLNADSIIACEVVTPAGNWSSYPPHKHDQEREGQETQLEEIYYFELRAEDGAPQDCDPVGYQRVYGTPDRPIEVQAEVRSGDVVLVPYGWHGPAMAPPGYDMYYLNVMAGPGPHRSWLICDDPAHGWLREQWATWPVDPRLPFGGHR